MEHGSSGRMGDPFLSRMRVAHCFALAAAMAAFRPAVVHGGGVGGRNYSPLATCGAFLPTRARNPLRRLRYLRAADFLNLVRRNIVRPVGFFSPMGSMSLHIRNSAAPLPRRRAVDIGGPSQQLLLAISGANN